MKIAFYLNNGQLEGLDWTNVLHGNPGAGGTEYLVVLESYLMSLEKNFEVVLYAEKKSIFPKEVSVKYVNTLRDAILDSNENLVDFFVFKEVQKDPSFSYLKDIPHRTGLIVWTHNFMKKKALDVYAKESKIKSIICVSREMMDLYLDERAFLKMDYIYNGCTFPDYKQLSTEVVDVSSRQNVVTYIGSIVPSKSFHWLAKAWPNVLKKVPDAQLYVIGSGNLYDKNAKLGKYGITTEEYEQKFMPYLTTKDGKVLPSVHFMGKMGIEKNDILKKTKVGVPNPSGESETFGLTAVEMQSFGCHVVTKKCPGYLDTVANKFHLYSHPYCISSYIVNGLNNPDKDFPKTYCWLKERFDYNATHKEWVRLFLALKKGKCKIHDLETNIPNLGYNYKWLRVIWGRINKFLGYKLFTGLDIASTYVYGKFLWYKKILNFKFVK